jgi:hypothetical protein
MRLMARRRYAPGRPHCYWCKRQLTPAEQQREDSFTMDHIRPLSRNPVHGGNTRTVPCCLKCNQLKGNLPAHDWHMIMGKFPRWWKLFDNADQVFRAVLDEHRRRAYAAAARLGIQTMRGAT